MWTGQKRETKSTGLPMSHPTPAPITSSWISSVLYKSTKDGQRYLAILTHDGRGCTDKALLYRGDKESLPSWLPGLIKAGCGGRSVGKAYNKLVKSKRLKAEDKLQDLEYQEVEGEVEVRQLKEMMK